MRKFATITVLICWIIAGIAGCFVIIDTFKKAKICKSWPTTEGTIISSAIKSEHSIIGRGGNNYYPEVHYKYSVNNREFSSDRVVFGSLTSCTKNVVERMTNKYFPQRKVRVYYNPQNPGEAVLEPRYSFSMPDMFMWMMAGLVYFIFLFIYIVKAKMLFFKKK